MVYHDWCPLCSRRFIGATPEEVIKMLIDHMEDGSCEKNFVTPEKALKDDHFQIKKKNK